MTKAPRRLVIVGAGPIGIEAALLGVERGHDVTVLERGQVGQSLLGWGRARFFTPVRMNFSSRALSILGSHAPPPDGQLTGPEAVARLLVPLSLSAPLQGRVIVGAEVISIGRARTLRRDLAKNPLRAERPFRVLYQKDDVEHALEAEVVLDASGAPLPNHVGAGGQLAIGERRVEPQLIRSLGDLDAALPSLAGKRVLLIGHGHSAAHAVAWLSELALSKPGTQIVWAVRTLNRRPCTQVASDPLPERLQVVLRANELAESPPPHLEVLRKAQVESIQGGGPFEVELTGARRITVDAIVGLTGQHPDGSLIEELPVEISPVSEGAPGIQTALANVTDCLKAPCLAAKDLGSTEPGFFMIGQRAHGRLTSFLLQNGLAQLEAIFDTLDPRPR